jgi:[ribosomal protein S5]-alanine N-acetyltransferase
MDEIRLLELDDAEALLEIRWRCRPYLEPWEPAREPGFYTLAGQRETVRGALREYEAGRAVPFAVIEGGELVGCVTLSAIVRGVFQNAYIGYWIDEARAGRGLATEGVRLAVAHAFGEEGLHRVQAAVIPLNAASIRVLEKAGFREEGLARRYLRIAGVWDDHLLFALTREDAPPG